MRADEAVPASLPGFSGSSRRFLVNSSVDPVLRQGLILTLSMAVMNGANWLFHVIMSRALGPAGYGGLTALLGILFILAIPATAIQMAVAALVARSATRREASLVVHTLTRWLKVSLLLGLALAALLSLVSPWLTSLLRLGSQVPLVIAGTVLLSWLPLPVMRGLLQGELRFWSLGASFAAEGLLKLGVGVLLVTAGWALSGAVAAISLGSLGALALTMIAWRSRTAPGRVAGDAQDPVRSLLPYGVAVATFTVLTQSDVVVAKMLFSPDAAGLYAAASTGGKIVLYVTAPLAMAMLPEVVRRHVQQNGHRSILLRTARYAALGGGALVAAFLAAPRPIISLLFGAAYAEGAPLLWLVGLGMLAHELALLGVYYLLAMRRFVILLWLSGQAAVFVAALWVLAGSPQMVAVLVAGAGLVACGTVWWALRREPARALHPHQQAA